MSGWRIEYGAGTGPDGESFSEWWTVSDGKRLFGADAQDDAEWLFALLMTGGVEMKAPLTAAALARTFDEGHDLGPAHEHIVVLCRKLETNNTELLEALKRIAAIDEVSVSRSIAIAAIAKAEAT